MVAMQESEKSKEDDTSSPDQGTSTSTASSDDHQNTPDDAEASSVRQNEDSSTKDASNLKKMLNAAENGNMDDILNSAKLHFYFLNTIVQVVVGRRTWTSEITKTTNNLPYHKVVHPSDEAFAFLVLDNNVKRYRDMIRRPGLKSNEYTSPKYTRLSEKGKKLENKGWNDEGKQKFMEYTNAVRSKRSDDEWLKKRSESIRKKALKHSKQSRKRKHDQSLLDGDTFLDISANEQKAAEHKQEWDKFIQQEAMTIELVPI